MSAQAAPPWLHGVLPTPTPAEAIRIVTGTQGTSSPDRLTAHESPLRAQDDWISALLLGFLFLGQDRLRLYLAL
ncbi:hypothetical protein [Streptomyces lasiicapitis]|uniref:hypothetical protein n=1 Tax=Streptomyces lasiicapitis TaxID=1923961 RepID=UPI00366259C1